MREEVFLFQYKGKRTLIFENTSVPYLWSTPNRKGEVEPWLGFSLLVFWAHVAPRRPL